MCFGRFFHVYLRKYVVLANADVQIASAVKAFAKTLKVSYARGYDVDESVKKFVHFVAA